MKYSFRFLGLIAAASIVFFSCEKETALDVAEEVPQTTDPATEEKTTPEENTEFDPSEYLLSFGASFENDANTKVEIDLGTGALTLKENDEALAYNKTASAIYVYDGEKFVIKAGETPITFNEGVQVFYPASEFSVSGSNVIFTMPAAITGVDDLGAKNPLAGKIEGSAGKWSVTFKAVGSILQVGVTGARELNSLELSNTALDLGQGAEFTIGWSGDEPTMATTGNTKTSMTITGLTQALSSTAATYYFLLPAGIAYEGLKVTARLDSADQGGFTTFDIVRGNGNVARNKVMTMSFYAGLFSGGEGTSENPYKIANARDFKHISTYSKSGYGSLSAASFLGAHYQQTADINFKDADLSAYMIASASAPFTGTYDGGSKTLSNFKITHTPSEGDKDGAALFQNVEGGVLQNISISGANVSGGKFTAGLVGYATGGGAYIQNCTISSSTISDSGNDYGAGGLIGGLYGGVVTGCSGTDMTISTSADNKQFFGGIICYINGAVTVSGCELYGTTTVTKATKFGGIVGCIANVDVEITNCHNHSTINASTNYMGGICGNVVLGTISGCTNDGEINAGSSAAGIVATLAGDSVDDAMVTGCVNTGNINAANSYAGGVVAFVTRGHIKNSRSNATVIAAVDHAGGLIGAISGVNGTRVNSCFAKGNVKGSSNVGGFIGNMQAGSAYIVNSLAACNVVATSKDNNQAVGGFVGRIQNSKDGRNAWIGNCAVYDVIVKAINQTSTTKPVRVGGFAGVHNYTTTRSNSMIQNCYYQGVAENLGYGGGDDFTTKPTTINGGYHGGIAGYSAGYLLDCYSTPKVKANGSGGTYTNNTTLPQEFIYGNTNSNPAITTSTSVEIAANTKTLGGVLSAVDATFSGMDFSDWDSYEEGGKYYYYPASLTALGADFYKK